MKQLLGCWSGFRCGTLRLCLRPYHQHQPTVNSLPHLQAAVASLTAAFDGCVSPSVSSPVQEEKGEIGEAQVEEMGEDEGAAAAGNRAGGGKASV